MRDIDEQYAWPQLDAPFDRALREAVAYIVERFEPVGIVAAGTIIRGTPDATSDLDVYVIHEVPVRQRIQKYFAGVPAEIFVNPAPEVRRYFKQEHADGRPVTAHMLSTGWVVLARDPIVDALRSEAMQWLSQPERPADAQLVRDRYMAATLYEDALDVVERDPSTAGMLFDQAVTAMLRYSFRNEGLFIPRQKELLAALTSIDPDLGDLARRYFIATFAEKRVLAENIAERTVGVHGFFEWESEPDSVTA